MTTHRERCEQECTKDVIFLFQKRIVNIIGEPPGCEHDGEGMVRIEDADGNPIPDSDKAPYLTDDELIEEECAVVSWQTEGVWLDRQEAEAWGESHSYRFGQGRKNKDWQVYGMPAYGELAEILRGRDTAATSAGGE